LIGTGIIWIPVARSVTAKLPSSFRHSGCGRDGNRTSERTGDDVAV